MLRKAILTLLILFSLLTASAQCNQQISLDGTEVITLADPITLSSDFTIEVWIRLESPINRFDHFLGGDFQELNFNNGKASLMYANSQYAISSSSLLANTWYHVAIVRDGSNLDIYLNGQSDASSTTTWTGDFTVRMIGRTLFQQYGFEGSFDELRFWNSARSQAEIQANYQKAILLSDPDFTDLAAYFKGNRSEGLALKDLTSSHRAYLPDELSRTPSTVPNLIDSCQNLPVAQAFTLDAAGKCQIDIPFLSNISDSDGPLGYEDIVMITAPSFGKFGPYRQDSVHFEITFAQAPTNVNLSIAELKYDKDFAYSYTIDDAHRSAWEIIFKHFSDSTSGGLSFTDGCGNDIPFRCDIAWNSANGGYQDMHLSGGNQLSWLELDTLYRAGWGVMNHAFSHGALEDSLGVDGEIAKNQNWVQAISTALGTPIIMKHFVVPTNWFRYTNRAFAQGFHSSHSQTFSYVGGPPNGFRVDGELQLGNFKMNRDYKHGNNNLAILLRNVQRTASVSIGGSKYWYNDFIHGVKSDGSSWAVDETLFYQFADSIESLYGKGGQDNIWFASIQEVYEYLLLKKFVNFSYELVGNQLSIDINMNDVPLDLRFYDLSLLLESTEHIQSMSANGVTSFSYQDSLSTKLINFSLDQSNKPLRQIYRKTRKGATSDVFTYAVRDTDGNLSQSAQVSIINLCADSLTPLNVNDLSLVGKAEKEGHQLHWQSAFQGAEEVLLEHSNGQNGYSVLMNWEGETEGSYLNSNPVTGENLYRMKLKDASGRTFMSEVVNLRGGENRDIQFYPNREKNQLSLFAFDPVVGKASLGIFDLSGRSIFEWEDSIDVGRYDISMDKELARGLYVYRLSYQTQTGEQQFRTEVFEW